MVMEMESNGVMGDQVVKEGILEDVTVKHILKAEGEKDRKACQFPSQEQVQFVAQTEAQTDKGGWNRSVQGDWGMSENLVFSGVGLMDPRSLGRRGCWEDKPSLSTLPSSQGLTIRSQAVSTVGTQHPRREVQSPPCA